MLSSRTDDLRLGLIKYQEELNRTWNRYEEGFSHQSRIFQGNSLKDIAKRYLSVCFFVGWDNSNNNNNNIDFFSKRNSSLWILLVIFRDICNEFDDICPCLPCHPWLTMIVMMMMLLREICKNFDEMAGRLGEIPDETKELVELQRFEHQPIDKLNWFANSDDRQKIKILKIKMQRLTSLLHTSSDVCHCHLYYCYQCSPPTFFLHNAFVYIPLLSDQPLFSSPSFILHHLHYLPHLRHLHNLQHLLQLLHHPQNPPHPLPPPSFQPDDWSGTCRLVWRRQFLLSWKGLQSPLKGFVTTIIIAWIEDGFFLRMILTVLLGWV